VFKHVKRLRTEEGFTLIELLVVIVILGILAGVVVFSVSALSSRGENSACKADVQTVNVASEAHFAQEGSYAADINALVTAGFLKSAPSSPLYTVSYVAATGTASATCPT
jgi:prepilin-type N-terminal cleavage/methylation domain-containing protein